MPKFSVNQALSFTRKQRLGLAFTVFFPCVHLRVLVAQRKSTFLIVFPAAGFTAYCKVQWTGSCTEAQLQVFTSIKKKKKNTDLDTVHTYLSTELKPQTGTAVVQRTWWTLSFILHSVAQRVVCSLWERPGCPQDLHMSAWKPSCNLKKKRRRRRYQHVCGNVDIYFLYSLTVVVTCQKTKTNLLNSFVFFF